MSHYNKKKGVITKVIMWSNVEQATALYTKEGN